MKAILCGANGAMGKLVDQRLGDEVVARVSIDGANGVYTHFSQLPALSADVVIDFSHHSAVADVLDYCKSTGTAAVIGTTGHTEEERALIYEAAKTIRSVPFGQGSGILFPRCGHRDRGSPP